jgi:hypothetical protein
MFRPKDSRAAKKAEPTMRPAPQIDEVIRSIQQTERVIEKLIFEKEMSDPSRFAGTRHRTSE